MNISRPEFGQETRPRKTIVTHGGANLNYRSRGPFGVIDFLRVLLFVPTRIVIRTCPKGAESGSRRAPRPNRNTSSHTDAYDNPDPPLVKPNPRGTRQATKPSARRILSQSEVEIQKRPSDPLQSAGLLTRSTTHTNTRGRGSGSKRGRGGRGGATAMSNRLSL